MKRIKSEKPIRNPIEVIMNMRFKDHNTKFRHIADRRPKDARRSWQKDQEA